MLRSLPMLAALSSTLFLFACPTPPIEGEGDDGREGEGEEGEGEEGEGEEGEGEEGEGEEGEGEEGEGEEGEGEEGEGEGEGEEGEGEGEEGEGEGEEGEGEGEGEVVAGDGIDDIRAAPAGAIDIDVDGAAVTYVRPSFDATNNQAGFYVQQGATGPAIFVRDNTGSAGVDVGDIVTFTATETVLSEGRLEISAFSGLVVDGGTADLDALVQDFGNDAALVTGIADRESELQRTTVTLTADVTAGAGAGFKKAAATTTALSAAPTSITFRAAPNVVLGADLRNGCIVTVESPLGHTNFTADEVQFTAWEFSQIVAVEQCLARVVSASAIDATHVLVTFSRNVDAASVDADGNQFEINETGGGALAVTGAVVDGRTVTLTTGQQESGSAYTVGVGTDVLDVFGSLYDEDNSTAGFNGFAQAAGCPAAGGGVFISEVADTNPNTEARFVELFNAGATAFDLTGKTLKFIPNGGQLGAAQNIALSGSVPSCGTFVITKSLAQFALAYPAAGVPNQASGTLNSNGDDVYALADGATILDVYGEIGVDGTGQPWEFTDSTVRRNSNIVSGTSAFNVADWTITPDGGGGGTPFVR